MRLIDADVLQNILLPITIALEHEYGSLGGAVSGCMRHIDNAPTVDAVPVVRGRDCKNWHEETGFCEKHSYFVDGDGVCCSPADSPNWTMFDPDDFCSYGERKEGAD